jgi:hypothetical protein
MLSPLSILSLDQGKIYGAMHPLERSGEQMTLEVNAHRFSDQTVDICGPAAKGLSLLPTASFAHFLDWFVAVVAVRRT